jgi:prepilin-type N-terminal cleavage/methylation domain-containing protein
MSSRRAAERGTGFSLVECLVAVTVLSLLVTGLAKLTVQHDRLLQGLGTWAAGDPVWFVERPALTAALLGAPATLAAELPLPPASPPAGPLEVTVLEVSRGLSPAFVEALVELEDA